jgi:choline dehydrogenase-like flavoprotein
MDHPRATLGTFEEQDIPVIQQRLGLRRLASGSRIQCGFALPVKVQRSQRLLNCAAWTTQHIAEDDVWRTMRDARLMQGQASWRAITSVARNADQFVTSLWDKLVLGRPLRRRLSRLDLDMMVEQAPDPDSRVRLSERTDALGVPLAEIDWKIGRMERLSAIRLGHAIHRALSESGMPAPCLAPWVLLARPDEAIFADAAHPAGGTRMADNASRGVVDSNCKVFGLDNLYVAGSSIFPTLGHANPTLTIVGLAVRLAATLRKLPHRGACKVSVGSHSPNLAVLAVHRLSS